MKDQIFCQFLVVTMLFWSSQIQGKRCDGEGIEVLMSCLDSISKEMPHPPTPIKGCGTVVQAIGMNCVCEVITKEIEALIDMQKLVNLAATCGRPLAPRSHCGSYLVPGAAMTTHHG